MISSFCLFLLASAVAPAVQTATAVPATATVDVLITDRRGTPVPFAHVVVNGASEHQGNTNNAGRVVFTNMKAGSYILRVERDKFITFEKEFAVGGEGSATPVVAAISPLASLAARSRKAPASARPVVAASSRSSQTPATR